MGNLQSTSRARASQVADDGQDSQDDGYGSPRQPNNLSFVSINEAAEAGRSHLERHEGIIRLLQDAQVSQVGVNRSLSERLDGHDQAIRLLHGLLDPIGNDPINNYNGHAGPGGNNDHDGSPPLGQDQQLQNQGGPVRGGVGVRTRGQRAERGAGATGSGQQPGGGRQRAPCVYCQRMVSLGRYSLTHVQLHCQSAPEILRKARQQACPLCHKMLTVTYVPIHLRNVHNRNHQVDRSPFETSE